MSGWGWLDRIRDEVKAAREEREATRDSGSWGRWGRDREARDEERAEAEGGDMPRTSPDREDADRDSWGWKSWRGRRRDDDNDADSEDDTESDDRVWRDNGDGRDDEEDGDDRDAGDDDAGEHVPWWRKRPWHKDDRDKDRDDDESSDNDSSDDEDADDEDDDGGMPPSGGVDLTAGDDTFTTDEDSVLAVPADGVLANDSVSAGDFTLTAVNGDPANVGSALTLDPGATVTLNADGSLTFDPSGQFESLGVGEQAEVTFQYTISASGPGMGGDGDPDTGDDGDDMDDGGGHGHHDWRWHKARRRDDDRRARDDDDWRDRQAREERDGDWDWRERWGRRDDDDGDDGEEDDDGWRFRRDRDDDDADSRDREPREDRDEDTDWRARWRERWRRDDKDKDDKHKRDGKKHDRDDDRDDDDGDDGGTPDMGGGGTQVSDTATVTIVVEGVNDDPVAQADTGRTLEGFAIDIDVLGNDSDIDGDSLTVESVTQPAKGSVAVNPDGTLAFDPGTAFDDLNTGESETVSFSYTVADGNGGRDEAEVSVTVDGFDPGSQTNTDLLNGVDLSLTTAERTIDGTTDVAGRIGFPDVTFNLAFVVDVSNSTNAPFGGSPVGDQNGDGAADTILDAEIAGLKALSDAIVNDAGLTDPAGQVDVGVVAFSGEPIGDAEDAALLGTFDPGDSDLDAALEGLDGSGFTNFEAALQQTIAFFEDQPPADQNIVYFLSDGFPTLGGDFADEVAVLTDPAGTGATNVAVGVGTTSSVTQLDRIDTTGGTPQVTTSDDLTAELLKPPFEVVDFSLEVGGTAVAGIDADSVTAGPLGFTFDFADVSGLDPTEGAETELTATATIDSDSDTTTTGDQFELSVTNTIAGVVPPELLMG